MRCDGCGWVFSKWATAKGKQDRVRSPKRFSDKQERRNAKDIQGRRTLASGGTAFDKGDVKSDDLLMECKSTEKLSYRIQKGDLAKLAGQTEADQIPVFMLEFRPERSEFALIPKDWFLELLESYRRDRHNR
jgi:hypothetical protein